MGMLRSTTISHPGLMAQLEFLAAQHEVDIEYAVSASPWEVHVQRPPKNVVILSYHNDAYLRGFGARYDGERLLYSGPWNMYSAYCPSRSSGTVINVPFYGGGVKAVGLRVSNVIYLFFSLDRLFEMATASTWVNDPHGPEYVEELGGYGRWSGGGDVSALRRKLFDDIFSTHMPEAAKAIKEFSWDIEKTDFMLQQETFFFEVRQKWSTRLYQVQQEKWDVGERLRLLSREAAQLQSSVDAWEAGSAVRKQQAEEAFATYIAYLSKGVIANPTWSGTTFSFIVNPLVVGAQHEYGTTMGPWQVALSFGGGVANTIQKMPTSILSGSGYWHPHISLSGHLCMGNAEPMLLEAIGRMDLAGAITVVLEFLQGYNANSPYCRIEEWHPDYCDDDDEHESCYDSSSSRDCVNCSDRTCAYRSDAEERCAENHEDNPRYCINCRDCDNASVAEESCHNTQADNSRTWTCVSQCTTTSCTYHGDATACKYTHEGELCRGCENTECRYYMSDDESEGETEGEESPAVPAGERVEETA